MLTLIFLLALTAAVKLPGQLSGDFVDPTKTNFELWMRFFGIEYLDLSEKADRFDKWVRMVQENNEHNKQGHLWKRGVNKFTHWTHEEFGMSGRVMAPQDCSATQHNMVKKPYEIKNTAPSAIDWRTRNVVSEVKDQGNCGSCWAFSATGSLESHRTLYNSSISNFMVELSEQQLVECAQGFKNMGCNGGLPSQAFEYVMYNGGIDTEFSYPYMAPTTKSCSWDSTGWKLGAQVFGVYNVSQYDENDMVTQVGNVGPLSVCFDVVSGFSQYKSGVYESKLCGNTSQSVNHGVLAVGYGVDNGTPYWTVKNSWGSTWGNHGYFLIKRGSNECGIASCSSYPIMKAAYNKWV